MLCRVLTLDTSHLEMSPLNNDAPMNIPNVVVTLDTSHLEMSPLKLLAPRTNFLLNNAVMPVTAETFHDAIGPYGPLEQSADSSRHSLMADRSSAFLFGAHPVWSAVIGVAWLGLALLRYDYAHE